MTDTSKRTRVSAGVPTGGEFAREQRAENGDLIVAEPMALADFQDRYAFDRTESYESEDVLLTDDLFNSRRVWMFEDDEQGRQILVPAPTRIYGEIYAVSGKPWESVTVSGVFREAEPDPWDQVDWDGLEDQAFRAAETRHLLARENMAEPTPSLEFSNAFPYGPMVDNLNVVTGQHDFVRLTSEGKARPVLSRTAEQDERAIESFVVGTQWQAQNKMLTGEALVGNVERAVKMALGGQKMNWARHLVTKDVDHIVDGLKARDLDRVRRDMRELINFQTKSQHIERPVSTWTPPNKAVVEARRNSMNGGNTPTNRQIAAQVKRDLLDAQTNGYLPQGVSFSVTSPDSSVNVSVKGLDRQWIIDEGSELHSRVNKIRFAYAEGQGNYTGYYGGVIMADDQGMHLGRGNGATWDSIY